MPDVAPFPWTSLPVVDAATAEASCVAAAVFGSGAADRARHHAETVADELGIPHWTVGRRIVAAHRGTTFSPGFGRVIPIALHLPGEETPMLLTIDERVAVAIVDAVVAAEEIPPQPIDDWSFGALCFVVSKWFALVAGEGGPAVVVSLRRYPLEWLVEQLGGQRTIVEFAAEIAAGAHGGWARCFATRAALERSRSHDLRLAASAPNVPVELTVSVGRVPLTTDELRSLAPGDALLFAEQALMPDALDYKANAAHLHLSEDTFCTASISIDGARWQLTVESNEPTHREEPMDSQTTESTQLLGKTTVTVEAVIGNVSLDLRSLSQLTPGQILTLDRRVGDPVDIVANGEPVARGELVDVSGKVGVRVLSMHP